MNINTSGCSDESAAGPSSATKTQPIEINEDSNNKFDLDDSTKPPLEEIQHHAEVGYVRYVHNMVSVKAIG